MPVRFPVRLFSGLNCSQTRTYEQPGGRGSTGFFCVKGRRVHPLRYHKNKCKLSDDNASQLHLACPFDVVRITFCEMSTDFCYTQAEVDAAAGHPVSIGDRVEGLDWQRRTQGRGTKVWWHKRVYEALKQHSREIEIPQEQPQQVTEQPKPEYKVAKVAKKYANTRIVTSSLGDNVFVGRHGAKLKVGHTIEYKDNTLVIKKLVSGKLALVS